jgi:hypothetical protein
MEKTDAGPRRAAQLGSTLTAVESGSTCNGSIKTGSGRSNTHTGLPARGSVLTAEGASLEVASVATPTGSGSTGARGHTRGPPTMHGESTATCCTTLGAQCKDTLPRVRVGADLAENCLACKSRCVGVR